MVLSNLARTACDDGYIDGLKSSYLRVDISPLICSTWRSHLCDNDVVNNNKDEAEDLS